MSDLSTEINEVLEFTGSSSENVDTNNSTTNNNSMVDESTTVEEPVTIPSVTATRGLTDSNEIPTDDTSNDDINTAGGENDMSDVNTEVQSTDDNEKLPRLIIRDEDSIWQFGYKPAKYDGSYHSSECTYKRIFMPNKMKIIYFFDYF